MKVIHPKIGYKILIIKWKLKQFKVSWVSFILKNLNKNKNLNLAENKDFEMYSIYYK